MDTRRVEVAATGQDPELTQKSSPHMTPPTVATDSLDQEISKHVKALYGLRWHRNGHTPIARLPNEVLVQVFQICQAHAEVPSWRLRKPGSIHWWRVTHVCRHWRMVAIGTPCLWASPDFSLPKWIPEMLIRSQSAPLMITSVWAGEAKDHRSTSIRLALQHIGHIHTLVLRQSHSQLEELFDTLPSDSAPLLEHLRISARSTSDTPFDRLFNLDAPRLRRVHLLNCPVIWDSPLFQTKSLIRLDIEATDGNSRPLHFSQLLTVLDRNPYLQLVSLSGITPLPLPDDFDKTQPPLMVRLSHLSTFQLTMDDHQSIVQLMNHIVIPESAKLTLRCSAAPSTGHTLKAYLSMIAPHCDCSRGGQEIRTLSILSWGVGFLEIRGDASLREPFAGSGEDHLTLFFQGSEEWLAEFTPRILKALRGAGMLNDLEYFHALQIPGLNLVFWGEFLSGLEKVQSIEMSYCPAARLVLALFLEYTGSDGEDYAYFPLPKLEALYFRGIDFGEPIGATEFSIQLCTTLRGRYDAEAPVKICRIRSCYNLNGNAAKALEEFVETVEWDGLEDGSEREDSEQDE
ncbi:hypothetical protein JAAARDRAFT_52937 [Jaapia argillacea MUCL 33604]|uniref:F-box domain-containing protein n=1 Tax=Jaapia argillacea MUCL 33604 TaxID=933084 RepID=A0A067QQT1_9AGAM|nr:hypothetical protein JAAARDRAFT_52937 [Jaapia argillacea MUCL 33604]